MRLKARSAELDFRVASDPWAAFKECVPRGGSLDNTWAGLALRALEADQRRSADTHLIALRLPAAPEVDVYLKDESTHPSGSLKHRLARSLFVYGICNGRIRAGTPVVEASSGSTAVSVSYFAQLLRLPFHAVMPRTTSRKKVEAITFRGGIVHLVNGADIHAEAEALSARLGGAYLDQFTYAERVTDWRKDNVAEALFEQLGSEPHSIPHWIVVGAGTGGTAATIGRHIRYKGHVTRLCVVDVEHSAYFEGFETGDRTRRCSTPSRIEGVGRLRVEPSFVPEVIDRMIKVPDGASIAAMRILSDMLGRPVGPSTGANFFGVCRIAMDMRAVGEAGSVATLICDAGDRYLDTYYDDAWLAAQGLDYADHEALLRRWIFDRP